jgi:hypothetical protein
VQERALGRAVLVMDDDPRRAIRQLQDSDAAVRIKGSHRKDECGPLKRANGPGVEDAIPLSAGDEKGRLAVLEAEWQRDKRCQRKESVRWRRRCLWRSRTEIARVVQVEEAAKRRLVAKGQ